MANDPSTTTVVVRLCASEGPDGSYAKLILSPHGTQVREIRIDLTLHELGAMVSGRTVSTEGVIRWRQDTDFKKKPK